MSRLMSRQTASDVPMPGYVLGLEADIQNRYNGT
jgi:hypothetical protein